MKRLQVHGFGQPTDLQSFGIKTPAATSLMAVAMETQRQERQQIWGIKKDESRLPLCGYHLGG